MGNRKESLKRALGINEYPWSSDDENENEPSTSPIGAPRTDASPSSLQTSTAQQTRMDRDFFWSLLNGRSRITVPRSSSSIDLQLPPPRTHTQPLAEVRAADADSRTPASDMQRIRAFRMIGGSLSGCRPSRSCSSLFTAPRCPGSTVQFTDASTLMRARRRALQRATAGASALTDPSRCGGADANRCPSPRRRRATPPVPPVRNRIDIEMRAAPPPVAAEASGAGAQHEDEAMLSCIYEDIELPRPRSRPAVVEAGGSGEQEAAGVASRNTSALALEEVVEIEIEEIVEIDVEGDGTAGATAASTDARAADNVAAEVKAEQNDSTAERSDQPHGTKRKREETEEPEPSTVQEFNLSLLRLLECPVCLEWMEPPMSQCRRGHLVCGRCRARLASCPVCRTAFSSVRNRAMEGVAEMLRYPCRHGCGREVRLRRRTPHEASCSARRYRCVAPACAQRAPMPHQELTDHLQSKHAAMLKLGRRHKFALKVNSDQHDTWVVLAMRELFHLRIDVDIRTWGVVVHVAYIGPKCKASSYSYEVTVLGQHNSRKLVYTRATHCDLESSSLNVSRQDCFHLTIDQALNFLRVKNKHCEPDKFLHFCVEITKKEEAPGVNIDDSDLS